ncbi:hypothetical protein [Pseudobacteriovorax antillogorgiicola]|uniref:N-acetyltransferase domain-containing protein n=1 Tax=Pseudobacteriovorax antillogorgiicola TaxID=1513793 RepID=A0A1Y6CE96_9BACT|nr:hypothetical protein [Pseudobacteriovorax antillogorgiicola]TCS49107.1 hypothetical protein EDD56_116150 [Pseudobacteriovorax antillogorgiicola]SMF51656.1 hypothetical protein SAMN06296036_1164 [Pseudobacteriovorax antillogorgiicola]
MSHYCLDDFLDLPQIVYREDQNYTPNNPEKVRWQLSSDNPLNSFTQVWLDCEPGKARLAGFFHPKQIIAGVPSAFFGFWESIDDLKICSSLFKSFEAWAKDQGAKRIYGPIDYTTFGRYRLRMPHKKYPTPFTGEPYNPSYYPHLLAALGYRVAESYETLIARSRLLTIAMTKFKVLKKSPPRDIEFLPLTNEALRQYQTGIYDLIHSIFQHNFAYRSISKEQFENFVIPNYQRIVDPNSSVLLFDHSKERVVGVGVTYPDYSQITSQGAKTRISEDDISFAKHHHLLRNPMILGKTYGVLPEYRRQGLHNAMSYMSMRYGQGWGPTVACLARRGNHSIRKIRAPVDVIEYGLYAKDL